MNKEQLIGHLQELANDGILGPEETESHVCCIAIRVINQYSATIERCQQIATLPRSINLSPADRALITEPYHPEF